MSDFKGGFGAGLLVSSIFNIVLLLFFVFVLGGCASYDSTYWRHPVTGVTVECDLPWYETTEFGLGAPFKDRCESLMNRAGLVPIPHDEGKAWEATTR